MGRGKRGKGLSGRAQLSAEQQLIASLKVHNRSEEDSSDEHTFYIVPFGYYFVFNSRRHVLSVRSYNGSELLETLYLGHSKAEWLDLDEVQAYAAAYAIRRGMLECLASGISRLTTLRVDIISDPTGPCLRFSKWPGLGDRSDADNLVDVCSLAWLAAAHNDVPLSGGWQVRLTDIREVVRAAEGIASYLGKPLPPFAPRWRSWAKPAEQVRTRPSPLAE
jgi:hypothetical protein